MQLNPGTGSSVSGNIITDSKGIYLNPGTVAGDTVWDQDDVYVISRVRYSGNYSIIVAQGATLTIAPGKEIKHVEPGMGYYGYHSGIRVDGTLIADGTPEQRIVFTSFMDAGYWDGLKLSNTSIGNVIDNAVIEYNRDFTVDGSSLTLTNSLITNGINVNNVSDGVTISGNVIRDSSNHGIALTNASPDIINNTITANSGSGIYCLSSSPTIVNTILWNNGSPQIYLGTSAAIVSYSDIQGGWEGEGNIDEDPLFGSDYHLSDDSPCIGAGIMTANMPTTDIEGNPRPSPLGSNPDMGAYESALGAGGANPTITDIIPQSGAPGIQVTIKGRDFDKIVFGTRQVTFGGKPAIWALKDWTSTEIIAEIPCDGTYGTVEVKVSGRKELPPPFPPGLHGEHVESNSYPFTYNKLVVDSISPPFAKAGTEVTIKGQDFGARCSVFPEFSEFYVEFGSSKVSGYRIKSWKDKEIVVQAPSDLGSGRGLYIDFFESLTLGVNYDHPSKSAKAKLALPNWRFIQMQKLCKATFAANLTRTPWM